MSQGDSEPVGRSVDPGYQTEKTQPTAYQNKGKMKIGKSFPFCGVSGFREEWAMGVADEK